MIVPVDGAELTDSTTAWWGHAHTQSALQPRTDPVFKLLSLGGALV